MRIWRICRDKYAHCAFDGQGAYRFGGRWNHPGTAVVYASQTLSLCALELLVHCDHEDAPNDLVAIEAWLPDDAAVETLQVEHMPDGWRACPSPEALRDIGSAWVQAATSVVLSVPSSVVTQERNFLVNPGHPDFARVALSGPVGFEFDPRLFDRDVEAA